ncbi:AMP-binding protein [Kaistella sp.]|uniref:AMP-binding protein n=1 Tax=Kaistella sp. TaxID=2782235 RepID=UPI003C6BAF2D
MIFNLDTTDPSGIAFVDDQSNILTYGELVLFIKKNSDLLPKRSLVFILGDNTTPVASFFCACIENRWVPLLLNKDIDNSLLQVYLEKYKPQAVFTSNKHHFEKEVLLEWDDYKLYDNQEDPIALYDELSLLLPTSGSTGSPKLVRHSYHNLSFSAKSVSQFYNLLPTDVGLALLPLYYTMGLSIIMSHLQVGAKVVLTNYALTDRNFWNLLKEEKITVLTGVPYTFEVLFKMRFERVSLPSLRIITQGGGKLSENLWNALIAFSESKNVEFVATYGQTEGTARMAFLDSALAKSKQGSIGKSIPGGSFEVWDENDLPLTNMEVMGQLVYKGGNVTLGYAENNDDLLLGDVRHGILKTGDVVKRDDEGYLFIVGRMKRFLKIYGLRISLDETELLIKNKFNIECYAAGDDDLLKIYVTDSTILSEIKPWLSNTINLFHQAIEVICIEEIKRNSSGKIIFNQ